MSAELSITIFILTINIGVFLTPVFVKNFSENIFTNLIIKRGIIAIGFYLLMFNASFMATIINHAAIPLENEMFTYMWLFGIFGWLSLIGLAWKTIKDIIKLYDDQKNQL